MNHRLIIMAIMLFITLSVKGQNLFFIGENSFTCTETITLKANSNEAEDLDVLLAKDGETGLFAVCTKSDFGEIFSDKLIIYLEDGTVITCNQKKVSDLVDGNAKAVYTLSSDQLNNLINSNIHTVRFTLETGLDRGVLSEMEWNWTASNIGIQTKTLISDFLDGKMKQPDYYGIINARGNQEICDLETRREEIINRTRNSLINASSTNGIASSTGTRGISFNLAGRTPTKLPSPLYDNQSEGIVVVEISVDRNGNVTQAVPGVKGSTTLEEYFLRVSKKTALSARFDPKPDAPITQKGTITYHFTLK